MNVRDFSNFRAVAMQLQNKRMAIAMSKTPTYSGSILRVDQGTILQLISQR